MERLRGVSRTDTYQHVAVLMLLMEQAICKISAHVEETAPDDADELCSAFLALQEALAEESVLQ